MNHTPGPWTVADTFINNKPNRLFIKEWRWGGMILADLGETMDANFANARLMASAPEMLATLQACLEAMGDTYDARDADGESLHSLVESTIYKATHP